MMGCVSVYTRDKETLGVAAAAHLHGTDAEAPVDHELTEGCRALVAVPTMHHE